MPTPYRLLPSSYMLLFGMPSASCPCEVTCQCEILCWALHTRQACGPTRRLAGRSLRSHAASQRRGQASHPPRVRSALSHSQPRRARRPACSEGRKASAAEMASAVGWHCCLAGAQGRQRQDTCAQQSRGEPSRTPPDPRRQPRAPRHPLRQAAACGASENRHGGVPSDAAALRQGGARCEAEKRQEEDSGGE
jgi:hypothetical protein